MEFDIALLRRPTTRLLTAWPNEQQDGFEKDMESVVPQYTSWSNPSWTVVGKEAQDASRFVD